MHQLVFLTFMSAVLKTGVALQVKKEFDTVKRDGKNILDDTFIVTNQTAIYKDMPATSPTSTSKELQNSNKCRLQIKDESADMFTYNILKYKYNFVYLKLRFDNFSVSETKRVIIGSDWIWTYKGEKGAHQYLFLPADYGYLSFGLLWSHTRRKSLTVKISNIGNCSNITIGESATDDLLGQAFGNMTSKLALRNDIYNSSYWCYMERYWIDSDFLYSVCKNAICTFQTFQYKCCKYNINFINKTREVQCGKHDYKFGGLWWLLPIAAGNICWVFYPILLTKIGMKVKTLSKSIKRNKGHTNLLQVNKFNHRSQRDANEDEIKVNYISLKSSNPVTLVSTFLSPFRGVDLEGPIICRVLRIWIITLPITLSFIRVIFDYNFASDVVRAAVNKSALVGFSSIIAGPSQARKHFLHILGGPVVALSIYFVFGCFLISFPSNLEEVLERGLPERVKKYVFLVKMPIQLKERLSGVVLRQYTGYKSIHKLLIAQIFMLLNWKYWKYSLVVFYRRWTVFLFPTLIEQLRSVFAAVLISVVIMPAYVVLCLIELIISVTYFACPLINCFTIVLKAFLICYKDFFKSRGFVFKSLRYLLFLPMFILFCIFWYMYCIIFFDGFWFLSKIAMFTYSGIIAYPKLSYGYIVLVFMAIYYLIESVNAYGESYRELLKLSIEVCKTIQQLHHNNTESVGQQCRLIRTKNGIKRDLFFIIVDKHLPRRNQILITLLKFSSVITILAVSVELLTTFNKFQDLSVVSHVFTVLFICALPKIIRVLCMQNDRHRTRSKLRHKIYRTVLDYVRNRKRTSDDEEKSIQLSRNSYESLGETDSADDSV